MSLSLDAAVRSEVGHVRSNNQDSAFAGPRLLAVADGMGGHAGGDVASRVAIRTLAPLDDDEAGADIGGVLREALEEANETLRSMSGRDKALRGMGTTVTALLASGRRLGLAHIGDSRGYLLRGGELVQITRDHTYVQELVDAGEISADDVNSHPSRHMLMRALDGGEIIQPEVRVREAVLGDRYLLCSDGLTGVVSDETLRHVLGSGTPGQAADRLIELALKGGGPDNITVVVADVVDAATGATPQVAGAAALEDPQGRTSTVARLSAAGRAALTRRRTEPDEVVVGDPLAGDRPRGPRILRPLVVVPVVLIVLAALGLGGTYLYVRSQWYVGIDTGRVTVFRGVEGTVAGLHLQRAEERYADASTLSENDRARLASGITARNHRAADSLAASFTAMPTPAPLAPVPTESLTQPPSSPAATQATAETTPAPQTTPATVSPATAAPGLPSASTPAIP